VLIIGESSIGVILLIILLQFYPCYYPALSFYFCTYWLPTISVLNLAISPAVQNHCSEGEDGLEFFDEEFWAMRCPGCYSCGVMESSAILFHVRVVLVFRDIIYVINILYS
jgi:hypothetical protein